MTVAAEDPPESATGFGHLAAYPPGRSTRVDGLVDFPASLLRSVSHITLRAATFVWLNATYVLSSFTVQDLTPNIGLYWYFFIEMFDHFRNFFILVFQAHLLCYSIPICLKLRCVVCLESNILSMLSVTSGQIRPSVGICDPERHPRDLQVIPYAGRHCLISLVAVPLSRTDSA